MQRVALINGNNINQDHDLSKIFEAFWEPWVVDGLVVQPGKVLAWFWFVHINREWKNFVVLFENTEDFPIDTSWTKKVFVEILREKIIDWSWNAEDWSWIWHIKVSPDYPAENFMKLARIENGRIIDERNVVKAKHPLLNNFNKSNQLLKLDWDWRVPEGNLPPMNINIKWLPEQTLDWNSYIVANSWWDNYKWNLHNIFDRLYNAEEDIKKKMQIKLLVSKDFKITEWRIIYIPEITDYNEKDWYLWRWKVLVYRYNYWSTTEKSMIYNLNIRNRNEVRNKLSESNYIDNWKIEFNKEYTDNNWTALDRDQDARFNLEIYKLW